MGKPSIGGVVTPAVEREKKYVVKELTVLEEKSNESIYNLVFGEIEKGGSKNDE